MNLIRIVIDQNSNSKICHQPGFEAQKVENYCIKNTILLLLHLFETFIKALYLWFSTAGMRPGTGTWRPSYRDLNCFFKLKIVLNVSLI